MGEDLPGNDDVLVVEIERVGATEVLRSQLVWPQIAANLAEIPGGTAPTNWAEAASGSVLAVGSAPESWTAG